MSPVDLAGFYFLFFLFVYGWNSWKDFKTNKINAIPFAMLNGLLYTGYHILGENIFLGLLLTGLFFLLWKYGEHITQVKLFSLGDFSILLPFALLTNLFLELYEIVIAYLILFVIGLIWLKVFKQNSFCMPVFVTVILVFIKILFI